MRIVSGACNAIHAMGKSFDRTGSCSSLQSHVIHALLGCLGAGEVPSLGVGDVAKEDGNRVLCVAHDIHPSCETIAIR